MATGIKAPTVHKLRLDAVTDHVGDHAVRVAPFTLEAFDHAGQCRLVDRGRGPGTVCVITTDRPGWWNA